ncbi:MAG: PRC-barrel domain-containing protein [Kineosporiaceae bacterium]|nr:PRC-barrel domain-containing protein [Aeromicrobium sp.]
MTNAEVDTLVRLGDTDQTVADRESDIRGRQVVDKNNKHLGKIDALLIDEKEQKIRFLEVASGGFLGLGQAKSFIPVDAITKITDDEVHINQTAEHVAAAPAYDPALADQVAFYTNTYGYYGMMPFWGMNYIYPNFADRDSRRD